MKKTMLSFLCITAACMGMAQQPTSSDPKLRNTTPSGLNQPGTINNTRTTNGTQQTPVNSNNGAVNGHNTIMNGDRNHPGNNNMNNTQSNPTLNNNNMNPVNGNTNSTLNNGNVNTLNEPMNNATLSTTTNSAAYSVMVPSSVQTSFQAAYPAAGSVIWSQSGDWYRARYMENGKIMESSYREDGKAFTRVASPQLRTYVPEEVVNAAMNMYGVNVYAIAQAKGSEGDVYNVTIIENGQARTEWMNADGSTVGSPYRTEEMNTEMNKSTEQQTTEQMPVSEEQEATENSNSTTPAQPTTDDNMDGERMEPETLEQGTSSDMVDPANNINQEALRPENELESDRVGEYSPEDDPYYYYY